MRTPIATYRLQLNSRMTFFAIKKIVSYLNDLGVFEIYSSPILNSRRGSQHGYDVVDPTIINPELGGEQGFKDLAAAVSDAGMGWVQDVVPNHMAFDCNNKMLMDVLEKGKSSPFFHFFDILWDHRDPHLKNMLLVPVLGSPFDECLKNREIQLGFGREGITIRYYNHRFPLSLRSYEKVLLGRAYGKEGGEKGFSKEYSGFLHAVGKIRDSSKLDNTTAVQEEVKTSKDILWKLFRKHPQINELVRARLGIFNGTENPERALSLMRELLSEQWYRLAYWRDASRAINYRRFFDITGLISIRAEKEEVFQHTHSVILRLVKEGDVSGLRIDHIDGLYDPLEYLRKLRSALPNAYISVEKILDSEEKLPRDWPVQGTTGYDFLNFLNGIFCRSDNEELFSQIYKNFTGQKLSFSEVVYKSKKMIALQYLNGDVENLTSCAEKLIEKVYPEKTPPRTHLKRALVELASCFPVYRTYINENIDTPSDRKTMKDSFKKARGKNKTIEDPLKLLERVLLCAPEFASGAVYEETISFIMRFQQLTSPLMAKGFEDTALYIYNRLLSLNDVGGNPESFGISLDEYHRFILARCGDWPYTMNTTSTHDTKRGEDVRARINVLSEFPKEWESVLGLWADINASQKEILNGMQVPDRNDEYLLYQTLIGAFPFIEDQFSAFIERIKRYVIKAVRESKRHSSWIDPNILYEEGFLRFVNEIMKRTSQNRFIESFLLFQKKIAFYGIWNSLSQLLVKLTSPGIPDIYQGSELWNLTLVDPDNRSAVDFDKRITLLQGLKKLERGDLHALIKEILSHSEDGRLKLFVTERVLGMRKRHSRLYLHGGYIPIKARGKFKEHIICYARTYRESWGITVAPRFLTSLVREGKIPVGREVWEDTCIIMPSDAPRAFQDVFTNRTLLSKGNSIPVCELFSVFPLSLLLSEGALR
jgi:(1->4)-alpha-D-glucan 1-alpha-D-glucosylmutase